MTIAHRSGSPYHAYPVTAISNIAVTQGDLVVVMVGCATNLPNDNTTDNAVGGSNSYNLINSIGPGPGTAHTCAAMWYAVAKATETLTVTVDNSLGEDYGLSVHVYSGTAAAPFDVTTKAEAGTSSNPATSNMSTTTQANEVLVAIINDESGYSTFTPGTYDGSHSYTSRTNEYGHSHSTMDAIVSSTGTYNATATLSAQDGYWAVILASFKAATGASPSWLKEGYWQDINRAIGGL